VLRFWNSDVIRTINSVLDTIFAALPPRDPSARQQGNSAAEKSGGKGSGLPNGA